MAIEMIGRDVEENADRGIERRREIDLERGTFDHMRAMQGGRRQRQDGRIYAFDVSPRR